MSAVDDRKFDVLLRIATEERNAAAMANLYFETVAAELLWYWRADVDWVSDEAELKRFWLGDMGFAYDQIAMAKAIKTAMGFDYTAARKWLKKAFAQAIREQDQ